MSLSWGLLWGGFGKVEGQHTNKMFILKKLKIELLSEATVLLLGRHSKESKGSQRDMYIPVFKAGLFTTAKKYRQPRCPLMGEWINEMWYLHTRAYYSP